ncbi:MAG: hypothetical protein JWO86_6117, partial [Myxococcaceae bacterium]|nr:hypothetical protein [Myxococcaceae bacterium]
MKPKIVAIAGLAIVSACSSVETVGEEGPSKSPEHVNTVSQAITTCKTTGAVASRGLLSNGGFDQQPMKGVYYFPGPAKADNQGLYTAHPTNPDDTTWDIATGGGVERVLDRMVAAHVNTVVMSYWGWLFNSAPMDVQDPHVLPQFITATRYKPVVVLPAIEGGDFTIGEWSTATSSVDEFAKRIHELVGIFGGDLSRKWATFYDRNGTRRYAMQVLHAGRRTPLSDGRLTSNADVATFFQAVADAVWTAENHMDVGFFLDPFPVPNVFTPNPLDGDLCILEQTAPILGISGFAGEVSSPLLKKSLPCVDPASCQPPCDDNFASACNDNTAVVDPLADWKRTALQDWVATGLPVIADVSNGNDGRVVWRNAGVALWGDTMDRTIWTDSPPTVLNGTDDRWRNWVSEMKGAGIKGLAMDTWNGYTEGYAAAPTTEHGDIVYRWLRDLLEPDPRVCSHMHYSAHFATHRVYGAICDKWVALHGDRGTGAPMSDEVDTPGAAWTRSQGGQNIGRKSEFSFGGTIYWS